MRFFISDEVLHSIGSSYGDAAVPGEEYKNISNTKTMTDIVNAIPKNSYNNKCTFVSMNEIRQEVEEYFAKMCLKSTSMKLLKEEIIMKLHTRRNEDQKTRVETFMCPISPTKQKNSLIDDLKLDEDIKIMLPEDWLNNDFDLDYNFDPNKYNLRWDDSRSQYVSEGECAISGDLPSKSAVTEEANWNRCAEIRQLFEDSISIDKPKIRRTSSAEVMECLYECNHKYRIIKDLKIFYEDCLKRIEKVYTESVIKSHRQIKRWLNEFFNSDRCLSQKDGKAEAIHVMELSSFLSGGVYLDGNITHQVKDILALEGGLELIMFDFFNKALHIVTSGTGAQHWIKKLLLYILNNSSENLNLFYAYMMNVGFNYGLIKPNLEKLGTPEFGVPIKVSDDRKIMKFFIIMNLNVRVPKSGFYFQSGFQFFKTLYEISVDFPQIPIFPVVYINALFEKDFLSLAISNFNESKWITFIKQDMVNAILDIEYYQESLGESLSVILASLYHEIKNNISIG
uniref:ANK_REP_REGION domain-containing protein n=1 Tax=Strongyloides stercoralis TaxID=6248 RepID=A0A0K0EDQ9_STRER